MAWSCRKRRRGAFRCRPSAGLYVQEQMGSQDPIKVAHPRRHPYSWRISEWTEE